MLIIAIVLGGLVAGFVMWALDQRPVKVRKRDWDEESWWSLWD